MFGHYANCFLLLPVILGHDVALRAQAGDAYQYAADFIEKSDGKHNRWVVNVGNAKARMEGATSGGPEKVIIIGDLNRQTAMTLFPERKAYIEAGPGLNMTSFLRLDANNLCAVLQGSGHKKVSCRKVGPETLRGRDAEKWEIRPEGAHKAGYAWFDTRIRALVQTEDENFSFQLINIREGPQPDSLFELPTGYRPFRY
jgi:hypothetical protein